MPPSSATAGATAGGKRSASVGAWPKFAAIFEEKPRSEAPSGETDADDAEASCVDVFRSAHFAPIIKTLNLIELMM